MVKSGTVNLLVLTQLVLTTGPPYTRHWNKDVKRIFQIFYNLSTQIYNRLGQTIPGFSAVMEKVQDDAAARWQERRNAQKKAEEEMEIYGRVQNDP